MEIRAMRFVLCRNRPYIGVLQSGCNLGRAPPSCLYRRLVGPTKKIQSNNKQVGLLTLMRKTPK